VDPSEAKFTPARTLPATNLNKILYDRDILLQALISAANETSGNLVPDSGAHEWSPTAGSYLVSEQLGLKDTITGLTPFSSGVLPGDVILVDFTAMISVYSNEVGNYYAWGLAMRVSESATSFTSGTYANIETNGNVSVRNIGGTAAPGSPDVVAVTWSCKYIPAGTSGHVRLALAADRGSTDQDITVLSSSGRWRWLHLG